MFVKPKSLTAKSLEKWVTKRNVFFQLPSLKLTVPSQKENNLPTIHFQNYIIFREGIMFQGLMLVLGGVCGNIFANVKLLAKGITP